MPLANSAFGTAPRAEAETKKVKGYSIDRDVMQSIRSASKKTGVNFGYLMAQAAQESSFQPEAKASTSSATGLYQFLDSTWMSMVREHGAKHGLGALADQIKPDGRGGFSVADPKMKQHILDLRKDPSVSAVIGAEFALSNKQDLEKSLERKVGSTELYLAHFMGSAGASRFLKAIEKNASQPAANLMPEAAASNRGVFYDKDSGRARTVGEVYRMFSASIESKQEAFASLENGPSDGVQRALAATFVPGSSGPKGGSSIDAYGPAGMNLAQGTNQVSIQTMLALAALDDLNPAQALDGKDSEEERRQQARTVRSPYKTSI